MVDLKQAVLIALRHAKEVFGEDLQDVMLEEVEHSGEAWNVTVGFSRTPKGIMGAFAPRREYKVFRVDMETGEVLSIKIREVQPLT